MFQNRPKIVVRFAPRGEGTGAEQIYYPDPPQNGIQGPRVVNPAERNQKNPEFLQRPMAGPRGAGGMGASGPNRPQPDTAE